MNASVEPDGRAVPADPSAPHTLSLHEQAAALAAGTLSGVELVQHALARIERLDPALNSVLCTDPERALARAADADAARARGEAGALCGLPLVHKDIFCTSGLPTTCGSRMLAGYRSPITATAVARLEAAGAITLGKANMDEFAMGSSGENSAFGATGNPWRAGTVPGGSSSGSAALIAARLAPLATATDTGGSIRQPAAFCGVTGIKPTYGRVSRYGMIAFASSFDQGGVIATTAQDCALALGAMAGLDANDATSSDADVPDWAAALGDPADGATRLDGLRIGVPEAFFGDGLDETVAVRVREALSTLAGLGATLVPVELPNQRFGIPAYYVIAPAEASSNLSRFDGVRFGHRCDDAVDLQDLYTRSRAEGFGAEVQRRILIGTHVLSAGYYDACYLRAQRVRRLIADDFERAFGSVDVIAGPTAPGVAFARGANSGDPVAMYLNDLYTVAANLCGLPAMSLPCGFAHGMPVGLQLIGRAFDEGTLLRTAHRYQQESDWHRWMPTGAILPDTSRART